MANFMQRSMLSVLLVSSSFCAHGGWLFGCCGGQPEDMPDSPAQSAASSRRASVPREELEPPAPSKPPHSRVAWDNRIQDPEGLSADYYSYRYKLPHPEGLSADYYSYRYKLPQSPLAWDNRIQDLEDLRAANYPYLRASTVEGTTVYVSGEDLIAIRDVNGLQLLYTESTAPRLTYEGGRKNMDVAYEKAVPFFIQNTYAYLGVDRSHTLMGNWQKFMLILNEDRVVAILTNYLEGSLGVPQYGRVIFLDPRVSHLALILEAEGITVVSAEEARLGGPRSNSPAALPLSLGSGPLMGTPVRGGSPRLPYDLGAAPHGASQSSGLGTDSPEASMSIHSSWWDIWAAMELFLKSSIKGAKPGFHETDV